MLFQEFLYHIDIVCVFYVAFSPDSIVIVVENLKTLIILEVRNQFEGFEERAECQIGRCELFAVVQEQSLGLLAYTILTDTMQTKASDHETSHETGDEDYRDCTPTDD